MNSLASVVTIVQEVIILPPGLSNFRKAGHCKGLFVPQENIEGLFSHSGPLPFVKPIRDDKTPLFFESIPEAWLLYERFGPGVDKFIRNGFVFRPVRNKAPLHGDELPFALSIMTAIGCRGAML